MSVSVARARTTCATSRWRSRATDDADLEIEDRAHGAAAGVHALGLEAFDRLVSVDQKPIGRTPRSHLATYTEHHLDVIAGADWIIDLGPGAGNKGGTIVATGPPEDVARSKRSRTAPYLAERLQTSSVR